MSAHDLTILALDPSTNVTGVAVLGFCDQGVPTLFRASHYAAKNVKDADLPRLGKCVKGDQIATFNKMLGRARDTRRFLNAFVVDLPWAIDVVAFEIPSQRGYSATNALLIAIGMYLAMDGEALAGVPVVKVNVQTAKAVYNGNTRDAGGSAAQKRRGCIWAAQTFGRAFEGAGGEAEADAASVGAAAWKIWHKRAQEAEATN